MAKTSYITRMTHKNLTYEKYLKLMADKPGIELQNEAQLVVEKFRAEQQVPSNFAPVTYLVDFATRKYVYMDEGCYNLLGYSPSHYYETGLDEYLNSWHPADFKILNEKVFPDNINFIKTVPLEKYADIIVCYNYRALNSKGHYTTVMQRCSYVPGSIPGFPSGVVGIAIDISHFKSDKSIVHTIEEATKNSNCVSYELLYKRVHPVYEARTNQLLSKKEIEILSYMAEGLSSKQIAYKTALSINTVNNHRKNMLSKVECKTSSELMSYAIRHGLL